MTIIIIILICDQLFKYVFTFRSVNSFKICVDSNQYDTHAVSNIGRFGILLPT